MRITILLVTAMVVAATLVSGVLVGDETASAQSTYAFPGSIITVNTKVDEANTDGDCSLREAILAANTNAKVDGCKAGSATERDAIHFAVGKKAKTIVLGSQLPPITDPSGLRISGQEAKITISGNEQVRVFEVAVNAELALLKLTVADGSSAEFGGGLLNNGGTVKVRNTTFSNNSANQGGGIFSSASTVKVSNSTFSNNSAELAGGGIFKNNGTLTVSNSTFSNNSAELAGSAGGGIFNLDPGTLTVTNSTFSNNSAFQGGGIFNLDGGTATLRSTIVANSTSGGNCGGTITDGGYNIDDGTSCGFSEQQDSLPSTDPLLADQPAFNGGPTKTIALLAGSPAINAIPEAENGCGTKIRTDQRGVSRPQGSGCDIGAYEKEQ